MTIDTSYGLREILAAILGSTVVSSALTLIAGARLSKANTRKVTAEADKIIKSESADIERVINERVTIILRAYDDQVEFLTEQLSALRAEVRRLTTELQAARVEIHMLQDVKKPPAIGPAAITPPEIGLSQDF